MDGLCISNDFHSHSSSAPHTHDQPNPVPCHDPELLQLCKLKLGHSLSDQKQLFYSVTNSALVLWALCRSKSFTWNTSSQHFLADILNFYPSVAPPSESLPSSLCQTSLSRIPWCFWVSWTYTSTFILQNEKLSIYSYAGRMTIIMILKWQ